MIALIGLACFFGLSFLLMALVSLARTLQKRRQDHVTSRTVGITLADARELRERSELVQDWHGMEQSERQHTSSVEVLATRGQGGV